jgi:hypothetical protein
MSIRRFSSPSVVFNAGAAVVSLPLTNSATASQILYDCLDSCMKQIFNRVTDSASCQVSGRQGEPEGAIKLTRISGGACTDAHPGRFVNAHTPHEPLFDIALSSFAPPCAGRTCKSTPAIWGLLEFVFTGRGACFVSGVSFTRGAYPPAAKTSVGRGCSRDDIRAL